jgi:hypothetical protein
MLEIITARQGTSCLRWLTTRQLRPSHLLVFPVVVAV